VIVNTIRVDLQPGEVAHFLLASDIHFGSKAFDHDLWHKFCADASEPGAQILINGDLFDAIFPTDRKRFTLSGNTAKGDSPINEIIDKAVEFFGPLADKIVWIGYGNHEESCIKFNNFDPIQTLTRELNRLRSKHLPPIQRGAYKSFIRIHIVPNYEVNSEKTSPKSGSFVIFADHGSGNAPEVTKGTISLERLYAGYNADLYWMGHIHKMLYDVSRPVHGINKGGTLYRKRKQGLVTGTFQRSSAMAEWEDRPHALNYGESKHSGAQASGYARLKIRYNGTVSGIDSEVNLVWGND
jgi:hypothetical protein